MELYIGSGILGLCLLIMGITFKENNRFKVEVDKKYTNKDVCKILHTRIEKDLTEIKDDVKELLRRGV